MIQSTQEQRYTYIKPIAALSLKLKSSAPRITKFIKSIWDDKTKHDGIIAELFLFLHPLLLDVLERLLLFKYGKNSLYMIKTCYGGNFNIQEIEEVLDLLAHVRNNYTPEQVAEDMYISFYKITMRYFNKKKPKTSLFHYTEKQFIYYLRDWLWKVYYEKRNTDLNVAYNDNTDYRLNPLLPIDVYDRMLRVLLLVPKPPILAILLYRKALGDGYEEITKDVGVGSRRDMFKWNPLVNSQRKQVQQYLSLQENNEVSTFSVRPFKAVTTSRKERAKTTRNT